MCPSNTLIQANHPSTNNLPHMFDTFSPLTHVEKRTNFQRLINPYELISSTLHNNEFSPSTSLFNLLGRNENQREDLVGTVSLRKRNNPNRFGVVDILPHRSNDGNSTNSVSSSSLGLPPPTPALESLPLSVKSMAPIWKSHSGKYDSVNLYSFHPREEKLIN